MITTSWEKSKHGKPKRSESSQQFDPHPLPKRVNHFYDFGPTSDKEVASSNNTSSSPKTKHKL